MNVGCPTLRHRSLNGAAPDLMPRFVELGSCPCAGGCGATVARLESRSQVGGGGWHEACVCPALMLPAGWRQIALRLAPELKLRKR